MGSSSGGLRFRWEYQIAFTSTAYTPPEMRFPASETLTAYRNDRSVNYTPTRAGQYQVTITPQSRWWDTDRWYDWTRGDNQTAECSFEVKRNIDAFVTVGLHNPTTADPNIIAEPDTGSRIAQVGVVSVLDGANHDISTTWAGQVGVSRATVQSGDATETDDYITSFPTGGGVNVWWECAYRTRSQSSRWRSGYRPYPSWNQNGRLWRWSWGSGWGSTRWYPCHSSAPAGNGSWQTRPDYLWQPVSTVATLAQNHERARPVGGFISTGTSSGHVCYQSSNPKWREWTHSWRRVRNIVVERPGFYSSRWEYYGPTYYRYYRSYPLYSLLGLSRNLPGNQRVYAAYNNYHLSSLDPDCRLTWAPTDPNIAAPIHLPGADLGTGLTNSLAIRVRADQIEEPDPEQILLNWHFKPADDKLVAVRCSPNDEYQIWDWVPIVCPIHIQDQPEPMRLSWEGPVSQPEGNVPPDANPPVDSIFHQPATAYLLLDKPVSQPITLDLQLKHDTTGCPGLEPNGGWPDGTAWASQDDYDRGGEQWDNHPTNPKNVIIPAGETRVGVPVWWNADKHFEPDEVFCLTIPTLTGNVVWADPDQDILQVTIQNDDPIYVKWGPPVSEPEGDPTNETNPTQWPSPTSEGVSGQLIFSENTDKPYDIELWPETGAENCPHPELQGDDIHWAGEEDYGLKNWDSNPHRRMVTVPEDEKDVNVPVWWTADREYEKDDEVFCVTVRGGLPDGLEWEANSPTVLPVTLVNDDERPLIEVKWGPPVSAPEGDPTDPNDADGVEWPSVGSVSSKLIFVEDEADKAYMFEVRPETGPGGCPGVMLPEGAVWADEDDFDREKWEDNEDRSMSVSVGDQEAEVKVKWAADRVEEDVESFCLTVDGGLLDGLRWADGEPTVLLVTLKNDDGPVGVRWGDPDSEGSDMISVPEGDPGDPSASVEWPSEPTVEAVLTFSRPVPKEIVLVIRARTGSQKCDHPDLPEGEDLTWAGKPTSGINAGSPTTVSPPPGGSFPKEPRK